MRKLLIPAALAVMAGGAWLRLGHTGDAIRNAHLLMMKNDMWGAQTELRSAIKANPANVEAHVRLAQLQLQTSDPVGAEKELKIAREMRYDSKVIAPLLAQSYVAQQRFADVLSELKVDAVDPAKAAKALALRAVARLGLNDVAAARSSLDEAQRLAPDDQDISLSGARASMLERDMAAAERQVDRTLALNGKRADALVLKGQLLAAKGDKAGALDHLDRAVAAAPTSSSILLERANQYLASGQGAKARADIDKVLAAEPQNGAAIYLSMVLLVRAGQYADADLALGRLSTVIHRFPNGLYFQALIKSNLGQTEQAVDAARRYVAQSPEDVDGVRLLARIEIGAGRPEQAVTVLTKAIVAEEATAGTLNLLGQAYALQGKTQEASSSFKEAASLAPASSASLTRLASTRMQLGDAPVATASLERPLQPEPEQANAGNAGEALVAAALSAGDAGKAQAALDRLRQQAGDTEAVGVLTGLVKLAGMDLEGARSAFTAAAQQFPASKAAKVNLGKVLLLQNRKPEAEAVLDEVLAKNRADTEALAPMLRVLLQGGKLPQAIATVEAARAVAPSNPSLTTALVDLHIRAKEPKVALEVLHDVPATSMPPPVLLAAQARAQVADGDPSGAKVTYRRILVGTPLDMEVRQALVQLDLSTSDFDGAKEALREGLKLSPGNLGMMNALVSTEQRTSGTPGALMVADDLRRDPANMPASSVIKGDALMGARRFADAAAAFSAELRTNPSTVLMLRTAGALVSGGGQQEAAQQLQTWLSQHSDDADAAQMLGSLDIAADRTQDAEQHLQLVLKKRPNDPVALNNLAWMYQATSDPRARGLAQRAYLLAPSGATGFA